MVTKHHLTQGLPPAVSQNSSRSHDILLLAVAINGAAAMIQKHRNDILGWKLGHVSPSCDVQLDAASARYGVPLADGRVIIGPRECVVASHTATAYSITVTHQESAVGQRRKALGVSGVVILQHLAVTAFHKALLLLYAHRDPAHACGLSVELYRCATATHNFHNRVLLRPPAQRRVNRLHGATQKSRYHLVIIARSHVYT